MSVVTLPQDFEAWAQAEVAAGHATNIEQIVCKAVQGYRTGLEAFRQSLDDAIAEADRDGWLSADEVFDYVEERIEAREAFEVEWSRRRKSA